MISISLLTAAAFTFAIGVVHSWLGERLLIGPLLAPQTRRGLFEKSEFARGVLRFAWHITTLAWWGMAFVLIALGLAPIEPTGRIVLLIFAATFLVTGAVILFTSRGRHLAWPVFFAIAALSAAPALL